jgi:hypothetical protein
MGSGKKEAARRERQGKIGDGMGNVKVKGENFYRSAKKIKTLNMFKDGKAQHNAAGKVTKAASYQSREVPKARVEPNRKWFGNTRVISQGALDSFRQAVAEREQDPYQVLLKTNKLPMSLIRDAENTKNGIKQHKAKIAVEQSPFADTFGPKSQRKRVKLSASDVSALADETVKMEDNYLERLEESRYLAGQTAEQMQADGELTTAREPIFSKGQSKRIWNELYKVIDSSDVVIHVLDARDPEGTRCRSVEKYIKEEAPHKHLVFVLNKCDLVPTTIAVSRPFSSRSSPTPLLSQGSFPALLHLPMKVACYSFGKSTRLGILVVFSDVFHFESSSLEPWRVPFELKSLPTLSSTSRFDFLVMFHTSLTISVGSMGPSAVQGLSDSGFPCLAHQLLRQRITYHATPSVLRPAFQSQADPSWLHWLPQYWQVVNHKHASQEESLHCRTNSRRDESVAVHHAHETHLPHRLPRSGSARPRRYRARHSSTRSSPSREC